jgi:hypothetical protein
MTQYKYYFYDLLTHALLDELGSAMFGVNFSAFLSGQIGSKVGQFTGTFRGDTPGRTVRDLLDATVPGRTALWIDRDDVPVWCGIVWSRTYQATGRTYEISAQTFESYPHQVYNAVDAAATEPSQDFVNIAWSVVQGYTGYNVGVQLPPLQGTGTTLTRTFVGTDYNSWGDFIDSMVQAGAEYYIKPTKDVNGNRVPSLIVGRWDLVENPPTTYWRIGVPVAQALISGVDLQYPGGIAEYWWPENAVQAANRVLAIGKANGALTPRQIYTNASNLAQGYPGLDVRITVSEVEDQNTLNAITTATLTNSQPPMLAPTIILDGSVPGAFGDWNLGDNVKLMIDDPYRFPNGPVSGVTRIVGYSLTPASENGPETVNLTIDNIMNLTGVS